MFGDFKRNFRRTAKRLQGEALTIDDLTEIRPLGMRGGKSLTYARRQHGSKYWMIRTLADSALYDVTVSEGLALKTALDMLEREERRYADSLRGLKDKVPYNHFSKVREMLEKEMLEKEKAAAAIQAIAPAPLAETAEAITVGRPLELRKRNASGAPHVS